MKNNNIKILKKMTGIAMFSALAYVVSVLFRLPVMFLTFDAKDAIIAIASFIYGPISALIMSAIVAFLELVSISDTYLYGFIMNFASSAAFACVASLIYKYKRNFLGSIIGLYSGVASVVGVMMLLNIFVTPYYMGVTQSVVIDMLPNVLFPFNLAKALLNAAIAMLLYKPIVYSLRKARLIEGVGVVDLHFNKKSIIAVIVGGVSLLIAVLIFIVLKTR